MIKQPVRLIRLTYPERDVLLMKLSQFDNDIDAVYLLQKLSNQSANLLLTDDEIEALLDKLQMLRKDTDAQYLGEKIANQQTQLPSDVAKTNFPQPLSLINRKVLINNKEFTVEDIEGNTLTIKE